jgi:hypothetical protein
MMRASLSLGWDVNTEAYAVNGDAQNDRLYPRGRDPNIVPSPKIDRISRAWLPFVSHRVQRREALH